MSWAAFIPIIAKYGIDFAFRLSENVKKKGDPTAEEWAELRVLAKKHHDDYIAEAQRLYNPTPGTEGQING